MKFRHLVSFTRLSIKSFVGFHLARDESRPLVTSSLVVGRFAAKKGSLRSPRGRLVESLEFHVRMLFDGRS